MASESTTRPPEKPSGGYKAATGKPPAMPTTKQGKPPKNSPILGGENGSWAFSHQLAEVNYSYIVIIGNNPT